MGHGVEQSQLAEVSTCSHCAFTFLCSFSLTAPGDCGELDSSLERFSMHCVVAVLYSRDGTRHVYI